MRDPSALQAQLPRARQILKAERRGSDATEIAAAAARVYDQAHVHLDPLIGARGVQLLLVRSAKLASARSRCLADPTAVDSAVKLRACLENEDASVAEESAVGFFAHFFGLLTGFIGERLVSEVVRKSWPDLDTSEPPEIENE